MNVVVVGGTGSAGSRVIARLSAGGHQARSVSRSTGVDLLDGHGIAEALAGQEVIVDTSAPRGDALEFFAASTRRLLDAGRAAGVRHHVVLSVVGADRMPASPYMRAKVAQEELVRRGGIPFSIVRATQFHHFVDTFADVFADTSVVRAPMALLQPVAVEDLAEILADVAVGTPLNRVIDVAGPERMTFAEAIARATSKQVVMDRSVSYFGAALEDDTLLPAGEARLGRRPYRR